jgi:phosphohistidine swiveling domain-containing protein
MITLSNIFSREKTLFYFTMWNDSDRLGYSRFLGYEVKNNAFVVSPPGRKGSVWYDLAELAEIDKLLKNKISDPSFVPALKETLNKHWELLLPYLKQEIEIKNGDELENYYNNLVEWWSAMNTAFTVPDLVEAPQEVKDYFLERRTESEKYTEQMNKVFIRAWQSLMPAESDLAHFVAPNEAVLILKADASKDKFLSEIKHRANGCGVFNETIYPTLTEFHSALSSANVSLLNETVAGVQEVKGAVAFKGMVKGKVRIIHGFTDMSSFLEGEVLVTEMTNPDYVPIMRKAVAIVTDEGGMTCHAAIASRELKVPCVVGTKIATKAFSTGDMVEVDAEKGIVKILSQ